MAGAGCVARKPSAPATPQEPPPASGHFSPHPLELERVLARLREAVVPDAVGDEDMQLLALRATRELLGLASDSEGDVQRRLLAALTSDLPVLLGLLAMLSTVSSRQRRASGSMNHSAAAPKPQHLRFDAAQTPAVAREAVSTVRTLGRLLPAEALTLQLTSWVLPSSTTGNRSLAARGQRAVTANRSGAETAANRQYELTRPSGILEGGSVLDDMSSRAQREQQHFLEQLPPPPTSSQCNDEEPTRASGLQWLEALRRATAAERILDDGDEAEMGAALLQMLLVAMTATAPGDATVAGDATFAGDAAVAPADGEPSQTASPLPVPQTSRGTARGPPLAVVPVEASTSHSGPDADGMSSSTPGVGGSVVVTSAFGPNASAPMLALLWRLAEAAAAVPDPLQAQLDSWIDGATATPPSRAAERWRLRARLLVKLMLPLLRLVGNRIPLQLVAHAIATSAQLTGFELTSVGEEEDGMAGRGALDPLVDPQLSETAADLLRAVAAANSTPLVLLRCEASGDVCRRLHTLLVAADKSQSSHSIRRLCRALATAVCMLPRPHLSAASDSHKLLPLLLGWSNVLDPLARAAVIAALRHCIHQLPAAELEWHGKLLLSQLQKLLVFREAVVLEQLLPALFEAWLRLHAFIGTNQGENLLFTSLLADIEQELIYVSGKAGARRAYVRHLPCLFAETGLLLCTSLPAILAGCLEFLDMEVRGACSTHTRSSHASAPRTAARRLAASVLPVRQSLHLLQALLHAVWPRAAAHALTVLPHVLGAFVKVELLTISLSNATTAPVCIGSGDKSPSDSAPPLGLLLATQTLLLLLSEAGAEHMCAEAVSVLEERLRRANLDERLLESVRSLRRESSQQRSR